MKRNKTFSAKEENIIKKWYLIDAEGKVLGRLSTIAANIIRGKNSAIFTPHVDTGDFVIVINAQKIRVTGNKMKQKYYFRHSGYPRGDKIVYFEDQLKKAPEKIIIHAVRGMLPKGRLGDRLIKKLKVYKDADFVEKAQKPILIGN